MGQMGQMMGSGSGPGGERPVTLARLRVGSGGNAAAGAIPPGPSLRDLRGRSVDGRRSITFQMGMGGMMGGGDGPMTFTVDGKEFDADRIDQQVRLGTVEEADHRQRQPDGPSVPPARVAHAGGRGRRPTAVGSRSGSMW